MHTLLIVDVQNDFCPGGELAIPGGDAVIDPINAISPYFNNIILTQDWHTPNHSSFASQHDNKNEYDTLELDYGTQVLWPDHCVQGSIGAEFHHKLDTTRSTLVIRKGFRTAIDSYSAFYENDKTTRTGLTGYLKELGVKTLFITGLATDFCVKYSAIDAIKEGFEVYLVEDACRGIDLDNSVDTALKEMKLVGVKFTDSKHVKNYITKLNDL